VTKLVGLDEARQIVEKPCVSSRLEEILLLWLLLPGRRNGVNYQLVSCKKQVQ